MEDRKMRKDKKAGDLSRGEAGRSRRGGRGRRCEVISMDEWLGRGRRGVGAPVAREKLSPEEIPSLGRTQKAAFLLKFILCDDTTDSELDELVLSAAQCSVRAPR
jgi:hypothetical protein